MCNFPYDSTLHEDYGQKLQWYHLNSSPERKQKVASPEQESKRSIGEQRMCWNNLSFYISKCKFVLSWEPLHFLPREVGVMLWNSKVKKICVYIHTHARINISQLLLMESGRWPTQDQLGAKRSQSRTHSPPSKVLERQQLSNLFSGSLYTPKKNQGPQRACVYVEYTGISTIKTKKDFQVLVDVIWYHARPYQSGKYKNWLQQGTRNLTNGFAYILHPLAGLTLWMYLWPVHVLVR